MKFSESWLREWVNPQIDSAELVSRLTMAGLEVDSIEPVAPEFSGVVVGEITAIEPHPNADKLRVCRVAGGPQGEVQVVCGAPNARQGLKVPFATVGAQLPGDFRIRRAKLRDVESLGMLCAEKELGVSDADEGLWELPADAPVGDDLRVYLGLNDQMIEVDLTPNRGDCLSIRGLAREAGVVTDSDVTAAALEPVAADIADTFPVTLSAQEACPRYVGRVVRNINPGVETPLWMQEKLRRSGIRSIDPVVDITNYVLLELGQPMHAFDLDTLRGAIDVRMSTPGESLRLLDGSDVQLSADTLVIADAEKAVAMAGIMGGEETAVSPATRNIFLESAFFSPLAIAGKARSYGLHTDSSHRFERGVDTALQELAIERATALLLDIVGGEAGPISVVESPDCLPQAATITLRKARLEQQLGMEFESQAVETMMQRLGLQTLASDADGWEFKSPSWRFDLAIEADLVEEVARVHGYNRLPTATPASALEIRASNERALGLPQLREQLIARGYQEAISYSFVDPAVQKVLEPALEPVPVSNPISSDMSVMRTTLWSGLLPAVRYNLNRQKQRVRLFETGLRFLPGGELKQERVIAGAVTGAREAEGWASTKQAADFYDIKADVEALLNTGCNGADYRWQATAHPALHPGQSASVERDGELVGFVGKLHPLVQKELDISQPVFVFELCLEKLLDSDLPLFKDLSRFPEVRRDLAVIVDENLSSANLLKAVKDSAGDQLTTLKIFDVYQGKGVELHRKSVAMGLTFRHASRTLTEQEINDAVDRVVAELSEKFDASLRG